MSNPDDLSDSRKKIAEPTSRLVKPVIVARLIFPILQPQPQYEYKPARHPGPPVALGCTVGKAAPRYACDWGADSPGDSRTSDLPNRPAEPSCQPNYLPTHGITVRCRVDNSTHVVLVKISVDRQYRSRYASKPYTKYPATAAALVYHSDCMYRGMPQ